MLSAAALAETSSKTRARRTSAESMRCAKWIATEDRLVNVRRYTLSEMLT